MANAVGESLGSRPHCADQDMDEVDSYFCHTGVLCIAYCFNGQVTCCDGSVGLGCGSGRKHEQEAVDVMHTLSSVHVSKFMFVSLSRPPPAVQLTKLTSQAVLVPLRLLPRGFVAPIR